jgi:hypothetical protein
VVRLPACPVSGAGRSQERISGHCSALVSPSESLVPFERGVKAKLGRTWWAREGAGRPKAGETREPKAGNQVDNINLNKGGTSRDYLLASLDRDGHVELATEGASPMWRIRRYRLTMPRRPTRRTGRTRGRQGDPRTKKWHSVQSVPERLMH